ncbi:hypothetical protein [uncultured Algoriphagus sp.]|uniref:hypothetical protein n=1 Tax=uncultured Algoriphagus sp. TaxID=417365 RepID=UPI0030ECD724
MAIGQVVIGGYGEDIDIGNVWSHTEERGYLSGKIKKKANTVDQNQPNANIDSDLLNTHVSEGEKLHTIDDFVSKNSGKVLRRIINQRPAQKILGISLASGGPFIRYFRDPQNPSVVIDLRHVLIVGSYWKWVGNLIERGQSAGGKEKTAFDKQDYFSNNLGYEFTNQYGKQIEQNPSKIAHYLKEFLVNRSQNYYIYK